MYPGGGPPGPVPRRVNQNSNVPNVQPNVGQIRDMRDMRGGGGHVNEAGGVGGGAGGVRLNPMQMASNGNPNVVVTQGGNVVGGGGNQPNSVVSSINAGRVLEMLEGAKNEFEAVMQHLNIQQLESLEMERKIQSQMVEMDLLQQTLRKLEAESRRVRATYEQYTNNSSGAGNKMPQPNSKRMRMEEVNTTNTQIMHQNNNAGGGRNMRPGSPVRVAPAPSQMNRPVAIDERDSRQQRHVVMDGNSRNPMMNSGSSLAPLDNNANIHTPTSRRNNQGNPSNSNSSNTAIPGININSNRNDSEMNAVKLESSSRSGMSGSSNAINHSNGANSNHTTSANSSPVQKKNKSDKNSSSSASGNRSGNSSSMPPNASNATSNLPPPPSASSSSASASSSSGGKIHHLNKISPDRHHEASGSGNASANASNGSNSPPPSTSVVPASNSNSSNPANASSSASSVAASNSSTANNANYPKQSKVKWSISYSNARASGQFQESERPTIEMHHTLDHQSVVCCVRFSSDGKYMASGCHKTAQVFDVETGSRVFWVSRPSPTTGSTTSTAANSSTAAASTPQPNEAEDAYVRAVCFSPDGTKLVAGMPHNTIRTWDIASNEEGHALIGHESEIYSLDYVNNSIVSGSGDRKVRLWDATTGECREVFGNESGGPGDGVTSVALSPDGRLLAAASLDKVVRIWDTQTATLMDRLEGHCDSVYSIAFSPDGKNVISGSLDKNIMLWDVSASGRTTTRPRMLFQGHKDFVLSVAYTPDGRWIMSGSKDRSVIFWDPRTARSVLTLSGYRNSVISVASSPASPHFATGSGDCFACIWRYNCTTL